MRVVSALYVRVADLTRAKTFYERMLGIPLTDVADGVCSGKLGAFTLVLQQGDPKTRAAVAFVVDDLAEAQKRALELGGKLNVSGYAPGIPAMVIDDPDGNHLEFVTLEGPAPTT
jgi:predicted enzyme related to lactoylglutathione lyase